MKVEIIAIGRSREEYVLSAESEYIKRLKGFTSVQITELELRGARNLSEDRRKDKEADLVLGKKAKTTFLIVLDESG